ncbi:SprB repeat-containing protein [Tenacibaculum sp. MAR_2009_124]|uniref:SprB repeat-containing protein n=1 Tax=Tenacibaculum sp. MAR_2009_124 TaxID=1250059 RepID=UPI0015A28A22|nr:SprB repeat-containing protein [Tenacibaculum sp. MAR_2009_124]
MSKIIWNYIMITFVMMLSLKGVSQTVGQDPDGTKYIDIEIKGPNQALKLELVQVQEVKEHDQSNGVIQIKPSGGWPNYTYFLYKDNVLQNSGGTSISGNVNISNLGAAVYRVELRDNKYATTSNACNRVIESITLANPPELTISASINQAILCNVGRGSIRALVKGGLSPSSGNYIVNLYKNGSSSASQTKYVSYSSNTNQAVDFESLLVGNYRIEVVDKYDVKKSASVNLVEPTQLSVPVVTPSHVSCNGGNDGQIVVSTTGGTLPYTLILDGINQSGTFNSSKTISNKSAKGYLIQIRDANGCLSSQVSTAITQPPALSISKISDGNPTFSGAQDGFINISVSGGKAGYTYQWFKNTSTSSFTTTQNVSGLGAGSYKVRVTDANGCIKELTNIVLTDPEPLVVNLTKNDVKCFGESTGDITAMVTGGASSTYKYEWFKIEGTNTSIGTNSSSVTSLSNGNYKVKVTVLLAGVPVESEETSTTIGQPNARISVNESKTNISCKRGNSGSISLNISGGTPGYTYQWSNGKTTKDIRDLVAGSYTVRVTDNNNCFEEKTINLTEPSEELTVVLDNAQDPLSFGGLDGNINITVSGGTSSYTYEWFKDGGTSSIATTQNIANIGKGTYEVKVTDVNGCVDTLIHVLDEPEELIATISIPSDGQLFCHNDTDGKMEVAVTGGLAPYRYHWYVRDGSGGKTFISGATGTTLSNLSTGNYGVEVIDRDGNGVKTTDEKEMENPVLVEIASSKIINVACFGDNTGEIEVTLAGGNNSYIYEWTKLGETTIIGTSNKLSNVPVGEYKIKVTDNLNCPNPAIERTFIITQPEELIIVNDSQMNLSGFETNNGEINVEEVSGGLLPYTYALRLKGTIPVIGTTSHISNLAAGIYVMTVIDANNCKVEKEFTLTQPDKLELNINVSRSIACFGETGTISSMVSGGFLNPGEDYVYAWYNLNDLATKVGNTDEITTITGTYRLVVSDSNGNTTQDEIALIQNDALAINHSKVDVSCFTGNDGSIDITVSGGTNNYTYIWSNGETTQDVSSLVKGVYIVKVTDTNGCQLEETITISEPNELVIANDSFTNLTGFETSNGEINVIEVNGGTMPYSYALTLLNETTVLSISSNPTGLEAGVYEITITDAKGCEFKKQYTLTQPDKLEVNLFVNSIIACNGETGVLGSTVAGGYLTTGNDYTYNWYNTQDLTTTIGNESSLTTFAGYYRLIVTDQNGNTTFQDIELKENEEVQITYSKTDVTCYNGNNGSIDITVTGGTGVYTFLWNHGATTEDLTSLPSGAYSILVTDENGCFKQETIEIIQPSEYNITINVFQRPSGAGLSDGQLSVSVQGGTPPYSFEWKDETNTIISTTNSAVDIPAGNYSLKVTDSRGCVLLENYNLGEPDPLIVSIQQTQEIKCNGDAAGILKATATGGVGGNLFTWYDNNNMVIGTSDIIYNLHAGVYSVKVTDANGIEDISDVFVIVQPDLLNETASHTNLTCFESNNGTISLNVFGGTSDYFYRIKSSNGSYGNWEVFSSSIVIENLQAGSYDVQIKDSNDCFLREGNAIKTLVFDLSQPDALSIIGSVTEVTGFGLSNGAVDISVSGGTLPYSYEWTNSLGIVIANVQDIENLIADTYVVKVTDTNGCYFTKEFIVNQPDLLEVSIQQQNIVLCNTNETASIISSTTGGVLPYQYQWFNEGQSTILSNESSLNNIGEGNYYVVVTDGNNNISESLKLEITEPEILTATLQATALGCGLDNDWSITSVVEGGTAPYSYSWSSGENTSDISNVSLGSYFVLITDTNGCQTTARITLENPSPLTVNETITNIVCYNECSGEIDVAIEGGLAPYEILWNNGVTTSSISNLCSGDYWVVVTDQKGCQIKKEFTLINPEEFIFEVVPDEVTLCLGESIEYNVTQDQIVEYSWGSNNGFESNQSIVTLSEEGIYNLTVKTINGCELSKNITIHTSDTVIDAQFILTSQAFVGEDIAIINVSNPISENVIWGVPTNVSIVQESKEGIVLRFPAPGDYEVSLMSEEGNCKKIVTKIVNVFRARDLPDVGDIDQPLVKKFEIFSNPNDGKFKVNLELEKEAEVSLRLFSLSANTVITDKMLSGQKEYEVDYDINVSPGIYILLLEASKTRRIRKIIVQ